MFSSLSPTTQRRLVVALFIGFGLVLGIIIKISRGEIARAGFDPLALGGNAPDFLFAFAAPLVPMLSPRELSWNFFFRNAALILLGCLAYEISQIWMPGRTFDTRDIVAMFLGALLAAILSRRILFRLAELPA